MSDLKIEARIIEIQEVKTGTSAGGKEWSNQIFVVETDDRYPKKTAFQASGKLLDDVKRLAIGQKITVFFDVVSRNYEDRWYTQANAWKIDGIGASVVPGASQEVTTAAPISETGDDLPF
jgi:hypothetical protein